MKKILVLVLSLLIVFSLASCNFFDVDDGGGNQSDPTVSGKPSITRPTPTEPNVTTTTKKEDTPVVDTHIYKSFTSSEKQIMNDLFGEVIPFISNDEYYFETFAEDNDDGSTTIGISYYTFGNTKAEFEAYRTLFSSYSYEGQENDEYGDTWYYYNSAYDSYYVDIAYYYYEGEYVVDVYAYFYKEGSGGDVSEGHTYNAFTSSEKALLDRVVGTVIPFIPNDEYYVEEYGDSSETGVNFYTFGNTKAEFDAYRALFSSYTFSGQEADDYGDLWYFYDAKDGSHYVDMSYYETDNGYVVDVYVYYLVENGGSGGSGDTGDTGGSDVDLITNAGAGLPTGTNGVFDVDFTGAEYVKDVTDQAYYMDGCPTTGSPKVLVIPVEFKDVTAASKGYSTSVLEKAFNDREDDAYYSVYEYYNISSYGKLELDIEVLDDWFMPEYDSSYYYNATYDYFGSEVAIGDQLIMDEALAYLAGVMDLSEFDSDNNGIIDAIVLINTLDVGEDNFYWAYRYWNIYTDDDDYYYEYDGVSANDYLWASYQFLYESFDADGNVVYNDTSAMSTYTYIHEFGHVLGLDDYYDAAYVGAPLDGCDIMDGMMGDHNAYSKFNLGWITSSRLVTTDTSVTLTLKDFSKDGDTIIIANNWNEKLGAYQEYYVLMYYTNNGLNAGDENGYFARDGVVVYHVNASLYKEDYSGDIYYDVYNNNTDASDEYGTEDNLIEYVKSAGDTFTYIAGDTLPTVIDDNGDVLGYTFVVDSITSEYATITFTAK